MRKGMLCFVRSFWRPGERNSMKFIHFQTFFGQPAFPAAFEQHTFLNMARSAGEQAMNLISKLSSRVGGGGGNDAEFILIRDSDQLGGAALLRHFFTKACSPERFAYVDSFARPCCVLNVFPHAHTRFSKFDDNEWRCSFTTVFCFFSNSVPSRTSRLIALRDRPTRFCARVRPRWRPGRFSSRRLTPLAVCEMQKMKLDIRVSLHFFL